MTSSGIRTMTSPKTGRDDAHQWVLGFIPTLGFRANLISRDVHAFSHTDPTRCSRAFTQMLRTKPIV
jgi:hypothetical protein